MNGMIIDCHTHLAPPRPEAVVSASPAGFAPLAGQLYSLGIHPWRPEEATEENLSLLARLAETPEVVAVGEAGVDALRGGPMYRQMLTLRRQIAISESVGKPLVVHDVKAHDVVIGLRRDLRPRQPWILHGFRARPSVAQMMLRASGGFYFSFGPRFNAETLRAVPRDRVLAETDESAAGIEAVIAALSEALGEDARPTVAANAARVFGIR